MGEVPFISQDQDVRILTPTDILDGYAGGICAYAAHTCTGSEDPDKDLAAVCPEDQYKFLERLLDSKHMSVFEHFSVTVELETSRAVSHQIVRHRLAAYSQQSQRYVKYTTPKKKKYCTVINPVTWDSWSESAQHKWTQAIYKAILAYTELLDAGLKAEEARDVLPNAMYTKLIATWNLRTLLHILYDPTCGRLANKHAQAQIKDLFYKLEQKLIQSSAFMRFLLETYKAKNGIVTEPVVTRSEQPPVKAEIKECDASVYALIYEIIPELTLCPEQDIKEVASAVSEFLSTKGVRLDEDAAAFDKVLALYRTECKEVATSALK